MLYKQASPFGDPSEEPRFFQHTVLEQEVRDGSWFRLAWAEALTASGKATSVWQAPWASQASGPGGSLNASD